jgi:hypothetical protein
LKDLKNEPFPAPFPTDRTPEKDKNRGMVREMLPDGHENFAGWP